MHQINLRAFDLNLLVIFDALVTERSVSRAAMRVKLTQPAVSHALGRLRELFGDPLFIRTPAGMAPTALALSMSSQVAGVLRDVGAILAPEPSFDPARATRRFVIGMTDYVAFVLMPALAERLEQLAPQVELLVRPASQSSALNMLEHNEVELFIGSARQAPAHISVAPLFQERSVCAARLGHPAFAEPLTAASYLAAEHLHISPWGEAGLIDDMLARQHVTRRIRLTIGHFLLAPAVLARTSLIATLPERIGHELALHFHLALSKPPFELGEARIAQSWHRQSDGDSGHAWLRGQIAALMLPG